MLAVALAGCADTSAAGVSGAVHHHEARQTPAHGPAGRHARHNGHAHAGIRRPAATGAAAAALAGLPVKGRAPKTGYSRQRFGDGWLDVDGCDTRDRILTRDLLHKTYLDACRVESGMLADPYTAARVTYVRGGASEVDIDHVVALSDAWQKGAQQWSPTDRVAFANDPLNLLAVDAGANRAKGDADAATWLPPDKRFRCAYVARQVAVKRKYHAWVTAAERDAIARVLARCPGQPLPSAGGQGNVPVTHTTTTPSATPAPRGHARRRGRVYADCDAARAAGVAPMFRGTAYAANPRLDRDRDGIACER